jgi:hypothetical protein
MFSPAILDHFSLWDAASALKPSDMESARTDDSNEYKLRFILGYRVLPQKDGYQHSHFAPTIGFRMRLVKIFRQSCVARISSMSHRFLVDDEARSRN